MQRYGRWMTKRLTVCIGLLLAASSAQAGIDDFKLLKYVPSEAVMVTVDRDHDARKFVKAQTARLMEEFTKQHFEKDVKKLLQGMIEKDGGNAEEFEQHWTKFSDLFTAVEWSALPARESSFAMRLTFPTPEFLMLFLPPADKTGPVFDGIGNVVKSLIAMAPEGELNFTTEGSGNSIVHKVTVANSPIPLTLRIARHNEVILFSFGETLAVQSLALLKGESSATPLAKSDRFAAAMKRLPAPTDSLFFMDMTAFMGQIRGMLDGAMAMANKAGGNDGQHMAFIGKLIDHVDLFDYVAEVGATDGMRTTSESVAQYKEHATIKPLYAVFGKSSTIKDPFKYIPENAGDFSVSSGINFVALYDFVVNFIKTDIPEGQAMIDGWNETKANITEEFGVDIEKDILPLISGSVVTFSVRGPNAFSQPESVYMIAAKDPAKAQKLVDLLVERFGPQIQNARGTLDDAKIEGLDGFKVFSHPQLAMFIGAIYFGVKDEYICVSTGKKGLAAAFSTGAGKTPNVTTNERFKKEGLMPKGDCSSVSFSDMSKLHEQLSAVFAMIPMIGMAQPDLQKEPMGRFMLGAASKVGNVVRKLDYFQSSASVSVFEKNAMITKSITNYRDPTVKTEEKPANGDTTEKKSEK